MSFRGLMLCYRKIAATLLSIFGGALIAQPALDQTGRVIVLRGRLTLRGDLAAGLG